MEQPLAFIGTLCVRAYSQAVESMKSTVADWKKGNSRPLPRFGDLVALGVVNHRVVDGLKGFSVDFLEE